jgi:glucose dehydrogenase
VHPARQIRLVVPLSLLIFVIAFPAAARQNGRPQAQGGQAPRRQQKVDKKKEALKKPPLSVRAAWAAPLKDAVAALPGFDTASAYVPLQSGDLAAVNLKDGRVSWRVKANATGQVAAGDSLVFYPTSQAVEARDAATGRRRWRVPLEGDVSAPLVWQNGWLLVGTRPGTVVMLRAATGERLWQRSFPGVVREAAAMTGERLYLPLDTGHVMALALATGDTIWDRALEGRPTTLAPLDDRVFVGADDKFFYCLSAKKGKVAWKWRTGGRVIGPPVIDKDNVYVLGLDSVLRAFDRGNGVEKWHTAVPFRPAFGPFFDGHLLLAAGLTEIRGYQWVDGSEAGSVEVPEVVAAPLHVLAATGDQAAPFVLVTNDAQVRLMAPAGPVLESKPFPAKRVYPIWPGEVAPAMPSPTEKEGVPPSPPPQAA